MCAADSIICASYGPAYERIKSHVAFLSVTWLVHMCDMTRSYVQHDPLICATCQVTYVVPRMKESNRMPSCVSIAFEKKTYVGPYEKKTYVSILKKRHVWDDMKESNRMPSCVSTAE